MTLNGKRPAESAVQQNVYKIFPNDLAAENSFRGDRRHVVSAYLTFVALGDDGSPTAVSPVLPETEIERRRFDAAEERRAARLEMRNSQRD